MYKGPQKMIISITKSSEPELEQSKSKPNNNASITMILSCNIIQFHPASITPALLHFYH